MFRSACRTTSASPSLKGLRSTRSLLTRPCPPHGVRTHGDAPIGGARIGAERAMNSETGEPVIPRTRVVRPDCAAGRGLRADRRRDAPFDRNRGGLRSRVATARPPYPDDFPNFPASAIPTYTSFGGCLVRLSIPATTAVPSRCAAPVARRSDRWYESWAPAYGWGRRFDASCARSPGSDEPLWLRGVANRSP